MPQVVQAEPCEPYSVSHTAPSRRQRSWQDWLTLALIPAVRVLHLVGKSKLTVTALLTSKDRNGDGGQGAAVNDPAFPGHGCKSGFEIDIGPFQPASLCPSPTYNQQESRDRTKVRPQCRERLGLFANARFPNNPFRLF
jgi:hypothetical protein